MNRYFLEYLCGNILGGYYDLIRGEDVFELFPFSFFMACCVFLSLFLILILLFYWFGVDCYGYELTVKLFCFSYICFFSLADFIYCVFFCLVNLRHMLMGVESIEHFVVCTEVC